MPHSPDDDQLSDDVRPASNADDEAFVARLLLGALEAGEQRRLAARALRSDAALRRRVLPVLERFETFDADLAALYAETVGRETDLARRASRRRELLEEAGRRAGDLETLVREVTSREDLRVTEAAGRFFTWTVAEHLLALGAGDGASLHGRRTSLYLAELVIDVVDILGATGHSPDLQPVVDDLRRRLAAVRSTEAG